MQKNFFRSFIKVKANQVQYDLDRGAAKIFALSSKELGKYEYLTSEDLGYKPGVVEKVKFEYSPSGEALSNKAKNKTDKIVKINKQDKGLFYNSQHSFTEFKNANDFKEMLLNFMHKKAANII